MRILVFGGASELATAIVNEIADDDAHLVLLGRSDSPHRAQAQMVLSRFRRIEWVDFDATATDTHPELVARLFADPVQIAVVAFGILGDRDAWRDQRRAVDIARTNFVGAISIGSLLASHMQAAGQGQIIALSSVAGERVRRTNLLYGATKAGMDGFYTQLGVELADTGVKVLVVRPGAVRGRMTAGRRVPLSVTPAAVGRAVATGLARGQTMVRVPAVFTPIQAVYRNLPAGIAARLPF